MLYATLRPIIGIALNWYYRSLSVAGRSRIPLKGPLFLAANHPNALVDALVLGWTIPRQVRFTAKATIFKNPVGAWFFRTAGVVPLKRASDELKRVAAQSDGPASDAVGASTATAPSNTVAAATPVLDPSRNAESFGAVSAALAEQSAVAIFPEGKSHDEPQLATLRTGLARMALSARDDAGVRGIRILPIGLLFEQKEEPRSRVLVQVGEPIELDAFDAGDRSVEALTALVTERLSAVTLNFETPEDARRITAVSDTLTDLLAPVVKVGEEASSLSDQIAVVRRTERVRQAIERSSNPDVKQRAAVFEQRLTVFRERLASEHIAASDVGIDMNAAPALRFAVREGAIALLLAPISLWGRVTHFVPIRLARALAVRNVKSRDEPAMKTLVAGVALVLLAYVVQTAIVGALAGPWWALAFFVSLIPSASSDLRYGDRARRRSERMRTFFRFRKEPALQRSLLEEADWLRREAGAIERLASGEI